MPTFQKQKLSGSTDGKGILVVHTTNGTADTIHTAAATTSAGLGDNITLFAQNNDTVVRILTILWGGTTEPDDAIIMSLSSKAGLALVIADGFLRNALVVKAYADAANKVVIHGYVNNIA